MIFFFDIRYITMEELEQALREFGMNDAKDIKEIISEVDSDNVSQKEHLNIMHIMIYSSAIFYKLIYK